MPAAHYMHPEFGLLCPTRRLRHKLRIGFACAILALIGGAVLRAANIPPSAYPANALTAAGREESAGISSDAGQAPSAALATRASLPAVAESRTVKSACEQNSAVHRTWAYLEGKCVAGKARKPRTVRADRPAIAAIAIGRIVAPERTGEPVSSAASMPTGPQGDPLKSALAAPAEVAAVAEPPPRPAAAASKKPQKTARSHQRRREPTGTDAVWWREVRADDWGARGYGERDHGRGGYAREGAFGLGYSERDYGRGGYAREGAFGFFR
jgi:hypothetical protein